MHERLAVYVPSEGAGFTVSHIAAGSGIVGVPYDDDDAAEPHVEIYYEGNLYGANNIRTFADRVYHAASRLTERYPTIAQAVVPAAHLTQVGWYHHEHKRVELADVGDGEAVDWRAVNLIRLARWLDLYDEAGTKVGDLHGELLETRR